MDDLTITSDIPHTGTTDAISMETQSFFQIGDLVIVMARMWPGINKEGGVGKVLGVHYNEDEDEYLYDVKYTVNSGRELKIEEKYIKLYDMESGRRKIQGRCGYCGSFLKDCGHDEEFFRRKADEDRIKAEAAKRKREIGKEESNKRNKVVKEKSILPYDQSVLFIADHNRQPGKFSLETQEFYSESFIDDFRAEEEAIASGMDIGEYDSDYREENEPEEMMVELDKSNDPRKEVSSTPTMKSLQIFSSKYFTITITEESKQEAKTFHKVFYDNCLFHDQAERDRYQYHLREIKSLSDLHMLWTLINLCFNFIVNITQRIHQFCGERDDFQIGLQQNLRNLRLAPDIAKKIESGESLEENRRFAIAERIQTLAERQQMYFEQFEKAGKDIFDQAIKRFRKHMKTIQQPPQSVVITNKKPVRQKLEQVNLQIDLLSAEMTDALRKGRQVVTELYSMFEQIFRMTVDEVLGGQIHKESEGEETESHEEGERTDGEEVIATEQPKKSYPRIHDISAEAADTRKVKRKEKRTISSKKSKERKPSNSYAGIEKMKSNKVIFIHDSEDEEEDFDADTPSNQSKRSKPRQMVTTTITERINKVQERKKVDDLNQVFDFIDSDDDFELVNLTARSFTRKPRKRNGSKRYSQQLMDRISAQNSGNGDIADWNQAPTNNRLHRFIQNVIPTYTTLDQSIEKATGSAAQISKADSIPLLYQKVRLPKDPSAVYDGRVTMVYDVASFHSSRNFRENRYYFLYDDNRDAAGHYPHQRLSDYLIDHTIPSYRCFHDFWSHGDEGKEEELLLKDVDEIKQVDEPLPETEEPTASHVDATSLFNSFETIFVHQHSLGKSTPAASSSLPSPYFSFFCQLWEHMTTSPSLTTSPVSSTTTTYFIMNETILFQPFPHQWQYFIQYLTRYLLSRWKQFLYSKSVLEEGGEASLLLSKLSSVIFLSDLETFLRQKCQLQQENTLFGDPNQTSNPSSQISQLSETTILLMYIESITVICSSLEECIFSEMDIFASDPVFSPSLLQNLFQRLQPSFLFQEYLKFLRIKYDCIHRICRLLLQTMKDTDNPKPLLAEFDTLFTRYYIDAITTITKFLVQHPPYCLAFSAELLIVFSETSSNTATSILRRFLVFFYRLLQQVEDLSKLFQSFSLTFQKSLKDFSLKQQNVDPSSNMTQTIVSIMSMKYLGLKFFEKFNYHLHLILDISDDNTSSLLLLSDPQKYSLRSPHKNHHNGLKPFQVNDFTFTLKNKAIRSNFLTSTNSGSLEVLWMLLIIYSNAQYGILHESSLPGKLGGQVPSSSLRIFRIPSNWSFVKYIYRQLLAPLSSLSSLTSKNERYFKQEVEKRMKLWMSYQERLTKFAFCWDQSISTGFEAYLQILQQSKHLFDRLPSLRPQIITDSSSPHPRNPQKFDAKLFLLLTDLTLRQYEENNHTDSKLSMLVARERLEYQLAFILHLLFRSQQLIDPNEELFLSSSSSTSSPILYYSGSIYRSLEKSFKDFLLYSILSYSSSTAKTKISSFTFDLILYRKLKSEVKRQKQKLLELFRQHPTYSMGLVLLSLLKPCFTIFGYQTVVEELKLFEDCQKLLIESSIKLTLGDQEYLSLSSRTQEANTSYNTIAAIEADPERLVASHRSFLLLYQAIAIFHPLPIYTELHFTTTNNSNSTIASNSTSNGQVDTPLYITAEEFLPIHKRIDEQQKKDHETLSPFLSIYKMVHMICSQAYQNQEEAISTSMASLHLACITLGTNLLANWGVCTIESSDPIRSEEIREKEISSFRSDLTLPSLPTSLIQQLCSSLSFLINSSSGKKANPNPIISIATAKSNKPLSSAAANISFTPTQLSEFTSYILVMKLILENILHYAQQLSLSLSQDYHRLIQKSSPSEAERTILAGYQERMTAAIMDAEKILLMIHPLLFHDQIQRWYHYQVKKCFIYSNTLSFSPPSISRSNPQAPLFSFATVEQYEDSLLDEQRQSSHRQRQYYRQWHAYSSLVTYSQVLGKVFLVVSQLEEMKQTWNLSKSTSASSDLLSLLQPISRCFEMTTSVSGRYLSPSSSTANPDFLFTTNPTMGRKTIETTHYFTYEILKYYYFATILEGITSASPNMTARLQFYQKLIYPQILFPQLGHLYQSVLVITSILDVKSSLLQEMQLSLTLQRLSRFLLLMTGSDSFVVDHPYGTIATTTSSLLLIEKMVETIFVSVQDEMIASNLDQFLRYLESIINSSLSAASNQTLEIIVRWLQSTGELIFRSIPIIPRCLLTITNLMSQYYLIYGTFLNQSIPTLNSNTSVLSGKRLIPISQTSFFYHEFLESFIQEFMTSLATPQGRAGYQQELTTSSNSTTVLYLQWMIIIFQSIHLIPFATQIKEWDRVLYPIVYLYAIAMPTSETWRLLSEGEQSLIHSLRNDFMAFLVMSLIIPLITEDITSEDSATSTEDPNMIAIRDKVATILQRFTPQNGTTNHITSSISFTLSLAKMNHLLPLFLQQWKQFQRYQSQLFPTISENSLPEQTTIKASFRRDRETVQQQHREFLSHLLLPTSQFEMTSNCQTILQSNDSKLTAFTIAAGIENFLVQLRLVLQPAIY